MVTFWSIIENVAVFWDTFYLYINGFDTVNYRLLEGDPTFVIVQQILFLEIYLL